MRRSTASTTSTSTRQPSTRVPSWQLSRICGTRIIGMQSLDTSLPPTPTVSVEPGNVLKLIDGARITGKYPLVIAKALEEYGEPGLILQGKTLVKLADLESRRRGPHRPQ